MSKSLLTVKQQEELNYAILDYFHSNGYQKSFSCIAEELSLTHVSDGKQKYSGILEKKWLSVIRLQKKIMELESKVSSLQEEIDSLPAGGRKSNSSGDGIPRAPEALSLSGHRGPITFVTFHPLFSVIATASEDCTIKIWDSETGEFERTLKGHTKSVLSIDFDSKGNNMVSCSADMTIKIWDVQNEYSCSKTLYGHDHTISCVKYVGGDGVGGEQIVSCSRDKTIKFWETSTGFCSKTLTGHEDWVRYLCQDECGKMLASCSNDQSIRIWDMSSGECKNILKGHDHVIECVKFLPASSAKYVKDMLSNNNNNNGSGNNGDGPSAYLVSGSRDKSIKIWDCYSGQCVLTLTGHDNWIRDVCVVNASGKFLLSVSDDKTLRVWDLSLARCVKTYEAHSHFVTTLASSTRSPLVATGSVDQSIKIWNCR